MNEMYMRQYSEKIAGSGDYRDVCINADWCIVNPNFQPSSLILDPRLFHFILRIFSNPPLIKTQPFIRDKSAYTPQ